MNLAIIVAHPDDEFFASGAICELKPLFQSVHLIFATSGEGARYTDHFRKDGETRKDVRKREGRSSGEILGVNKIEFLGFPDPEPSDGKLECGFSKTELADRLENYFSTHDINACITHGSQGEYGHPAHVIVHKAVREAAHASKTTNFVFTFGAYDILTRSLFQTNLTDPARYRFDIRPHKLVRKQVLEAHRSQLHCFAPYDMVDTEKKKGDINTLTNNIVNLRSHEALHLAYKHADTECFNAWQVNSIHYVANVLLCALAPRTKFLQKLLARVSR